MRAVEGGVGRPGHSPQALVAVWIYAFSKGTVFAREIERCSTSPACVGSPASRRSTITAFRTSGSGMARRVRELFEQVLAMLTMKGLITLERVAVDAARSFAPTRASLSFRKRDKIQAHLDLARKHLDELERQERVEQATQRERLGAAACGARARTAARGSARGDRGLRAAKKGDKKTEPQASSSDPTAAFMWMHEGGLASRHNVQIAADSAHALIAESRS